MKRPVLSLLVILASLGSAFAALTPEEEAKLHLQEIKGLYAEGNYEQCKKALIKTQDLKNAGKLSFNQTEEAELYLYQALIVYAFREEGWQKNINDLLLKAIETDLNYELKDFAIVPSYILERYQNLKKGFLAQYTKSAKRQCVGIYGVLSYLPTLVNNPEYIKLGLHYSFNFDDHLTMLLDLELPLALPLFNVMQVRSGLIWFPAFRVELISLGLGIMYALEIQQFKSFINKISFEGYGEIILRSGIGFGASVELLRVELLLGEGTLENLDYVDLFAGQNVRFVFANLRVYIFLNF